MRTLFAGSLLACLWHSAAFGQCAPAPDSAYFFRNLSEQRAEARISANRKTYEHLLGENFTTPGANGKPQSKDEFIAAELAQSPADPHQQFYSISNYTLLEHRQGHTVASYLLREVTTMNGVTHVVSWQLREVYEVQDGAWRLVAVEATPEPARTTRAG